MKKLIAILALLTIVSCSNKSSFDNYLEHKSELNQCLLDEAIKGTDSLTACIKCEEILK